MWTHHCQGIQVALCRASAPGLGGVLVGEAGQADRDKGARWASRVLVLVRTDRQRLTTRAEIRTLADGQ